MGKSALLIIAKKMFRDEEYAEPKKILSLAGLKVLTASSSLGTAEGRLGLKTEVDITLSQVKVEDYEVIIFVGGPGSKEYFNNPTALDIARKAVRPGKILASICSAGGILANAGVLKGKKATSFPAEGPLLKEKGALYTAGHLEIDNSTDSIIITADCPENATIFSEAIVEELKKL